MLYSVDMQNRERILKIIYAAIEEINHELPDGERLEMAETTTLYGAGARLDSLGLVNLIVVAEQGLNDEFGRALTLADEKAMSQTRSPFSTVGALATYVESLLADTRA